MHLICLTNSLKMVTNHIMLLNIGGVGLYHVMEKQEIWDLYCVAAENYEDALF